MHRVLEFSVLGIAATVFACGGSKPSSKPSSTHTSEAPAPALHNAPAPDNAEDLITAEKAKPSVRTSLTGIASPFKATVRIDGTTGGIDEERSSDVLWASATKLEACAYESDFESHWSVGLQFTIDLSGKAKIEIEGGKAPLVACLERVTSAMVFPQAEEATTITAAIMIQHLGPAGQTSPATGRFTLKSDVEDGQKTKPAQTGNGQPSTPGALSKDVIRRVIRTKLPRFRYCYESQLMVSPNLSGTVIARFTIGTSGNVAQVTSTGMDPSVSHCVTKTIRSLQFPPPKGGGIVNVTYPFTFAPASAP